MSLAGRAALITGAARGIGFETARLLLRRGMRVAVNDLDAEAANRAAASLGTGVIACPTDVTCSNEVASMFHRVEIELGPLWLVVNNAGTYHASPAQDFPEDDWDREFAVDTKAAFLCSREAIRRMIPRRAGRIVVISSIAGAIVRSGQIAYSSAKAAAIHFSRCLAVEMAPHGITVNCVCPGMTDSEMLRQTARARGIDIADYTAMIPDGRFATGEDHANAIAWLASEEAAHITGQVISIDGGQSLFHPLTLKG